MDAFPPPPATQGYTLRKANKGDLDDITRIHVEGFVQEPMDNYCYPLRFKYYEDHFKWMRTEYEYYLDNSHKYVVHVAEAPEQPDGGDKGKQPMALAVWNTAVVAGAPTLDRGLGQRKDANKKHVEAYIQVASKRYEPDGFFYKWGEKQMTLSVLTVLPSFRRRGIGTMMVHWGTQAAAEKGFPVTVCASPQGELLYVHLKFERIGTEVIQAADEEESFESAVMVLFPEE
ncbi:hypothetical protein QQX98_006272 [Neonectria punicea]|uniref:N-acetyltransferase domain-containing protein n=1 Tax=Neonectria punicea TaxID=979145 RepID=A0ABR1H243_9HYPO